MTDVLELPNPATLNGEQLRQIVNDALDAIVVMDDKGLLVGWNSQAEFVFGWSGQEVIGQPMSDVIIPPQHRAAHRQGLEHYLKTGEGPVLRRRIEVTALRKNGDEFPVELSISPVHFEDGVIFSAFVRDISAYEHKGSEADLAKRAAALEVVAQVAAATSTILETDKLLQGVVDLTKERFGLYHAHIYLLDRTGDMLGLTAGAGETGRKMVDQGWRIPFAREQSLVAQAARRKKGTIVNDVQADPNFLPNPLLPNTRSEMAVPMMAGDRLLGVLDVQADTVGRFTDEDAHIQTTLAAQVAAALENARLFERTEFALEEAKALRRLADQSYQASADLNTAQSYDDVLAVLRQYTILGQNAQNISLNYFDRPWTEDQTPEWINTLGRWSELPTEAVSPRYPLAAFPSANELLRPNAPTLIEDIATDPRVGDNARALYTRRFGAKSTIFVPMVVGGQWIGYVNGIYQQPTEFQGPDVRRLVSLVGQAAVVVQAIRRLGETERRARRERLLYEMGATMRKSLDVENILKTGLQTIGRELDRSGIAVHLEN